MTILRSRVLPRWLGPAGLVTSALYLTNQGDILATAIPGFAVWDLGGFLGSASWGPWVAALGVMVLLRPARADHTAPESGVDIGSLAPSPRLPASAGVRS